MAKRRVASLISVCAGSLAAICIALLAYRRAQTQHLFIVDVTERGVQESSEASGTSSIGPISPMSAYDDTLTVTLLVWGLVSAGLAVGASVYAYRSGVRDHLAAMGLVVGVFSIAWMGTTFLL